MRSKNGLNIAILKKPQRQYSLSISKKYNKTLATAKTNYRILPCVNKKSLDYSKNTYFIFVMYSWMPFHPQEPIYTYIFEVTMLITDIFLLL